MKKPFLKFLIIETIILIAAMAALFINAFSYQNREVDVVKVNSYVQTVKENWKDRALDETDLFQTPVMLIGSDGKILYQSDDKIFKGIKMESDAIRKKNALYFCDG